MSGGKLSSGDNAGLEWAIGAIQELAPAESNVFTPWLKSGDKDALSAAQADNAHIVLQTKTIEGDISAVLPDWLTAEQIKSINLLRDRTDSDQLGTVTGNLAIFWLDTPSGSRTGRLLLLGLELIRSALDEIYPMARLTRSELHTLVLLTMGYTLKEAAAKDSVGYETKRSHLKAIFSKTHTKRQAEITATLLSHILINFGSETYRSKANDTHECFYRYIRDCLPDDTRHHILVNEDGEQTRYLDFGPVNGTSVLYVHHMGILYFTDAEVEILKAKNIRLICPLRNGALGPKDQPMLLESHIAHALDGIRMAQRMFCGGRITIVTPLSGFSYALEYLRQNPNSVENIVFVGAPLKGEREITTAEKFRNYFFRIALRNRWLLEKLLRYLVDSTNSIDSVRQVFEKSYADSPKDLEILEEEFSNPALSLAFYYRIKHSLTSIQHDLYHQANQHWSNLPGTDTRLHFVHGVEDKVHPISAVEEFARESNNASVYPIVGAGSFIYHKHTPKVLELINQIVRVEQ